MVQQFELLNAVSLYVVAGIMFFLCYVIIYVYLIHVDYKYGIFHSTLSSTLPSIISLGVTVCMTSIDKTFEESEWDSCIAWEKDNWSGQPRSSVQGLVLLDAV